MIKYFLFSSMFLWLSFSESSEALEQVRVNFSKEALERVRVNFSKLAKNKELCAELMNELNKVDASSPLHTAYIGGLQTIWANHTQNPINKLKTFNLGKNNIEKAYSLAPNEPEIRYIRLSVQLNAPRFLGYYQQIQEDAKFLKTNKIRIKSNAVQTNIDLLFNQFSKQLNEK